MLSIGLVAVSCQKEIKPAEADSLFIENDCIIVPDSSSILSRIRCEYAKDTIRDRQLTVSGVVKAIPNAYANIASPFAGRITKSFVHLGQNVSQGSPVFEISSPAFYETGKAYHQAKQEYELAQKNLKRQQDLMKNGVGVQKDLEEAEVNFELKSKEKERAEASLKVFGINPKDLVLGQPLIVRSPIKGTIIQNNIVIGQYIKEDAEPQASVAEMSKIWVVAQVKEKDISFINVNETVEIIPSGNPENTKSGKIYHVGEVLDESTRSVQVIIECDNSDYMIKPGMYVSVRFTDNVKSSLCVPSRSVMQSGDTSFVFVEVSKNRFQKRPVKCGLTDGNSIELLSGVAPGEKIITDGAYYLIEAK